MGFELVRVRLMVGKKATLQIMAERPDGTLRRHYGSVLHIARRVD